MDITTIINSLFSGFLIGGLYALIAVGMSLIFGVMDIVNLGHGPILAVGAYTVVWLYQQFCYDPWLYAPIALLVGALCGLIIHKCVIWPGITKGVHMLILTYGLEVLIANALLLIFGGILRTIVLSRLLGSFTFYGISISFSLMEIFIISIGLILIFHLFISKTFIGKAIRAVAQSKDAASVCGINVPNIYLLTYVLGSALAGLAGTFYVCIYNVYPWVGGRLNIRSFGIVALGGIGSVKGAAIGGIALGIMESVALLVLPAAFRDLVAFLLLIIALLIGRGVK